MSWSSLASSGVSHLLQLSMGGGGWKFTENLSPKGRTKSEVISLRVWPGSPLLCFVMSMPPREASRGTGSSYSFHVFLFFLHLELMNLHEISPCYLKCCSVFSV